MRRRLPLSSTLFDKDAHYTAHSLHIARYHRRCYCRYFYYCIALCSNKNDRRGVGRVTYGTASARHLLDSPTTITYVPSRRRPIIITCITSCASRRPLSSLRNVLPTPPPSAPPSDRTEQDGTTIWVSRKQQRWRTAPERTRFFLRRIRKSARAFSVG